MPKYGILYYIYVLYYFLLPCGDNYFILHIRNIKILHLFLSSVVTSKPCNQGLFDLVVINGQLPNSLLLRNNPCVKQILFFIKSCTHTIRLIRLCVSVSCLFAL